MLVGAGLTLAMVSTMGLAQVPFASGAAVTANDRAELAQMARDWIEPALANTLAEVPDNVLRPEVTMGTLDSRLRLAPCAHIEPYIPSGTRLWGRSRIGLRCLEGQVHWNVFVPVTVKAWGPAWVLKRPVPAGSVLTQDDADIAEIDWAEQSSNVLATPDSWVGQQGAPPRSSPAALRSGSKAWVAAFMWWSAARPWTKVFWARLHGSSWAVAKSSPARCAPARSSRSGCEHPGFQCICLLFRDFFDEKSLKFPCF